MKYLFHIFIFPGLYVLVLFYDNSKLTTKQGEWNHPRKRNKLQQSIFVPIPSLETPSGPGQSQKKNRLWINAASLRICIPLTRGSHRCFMVTTAVLINWLELFLSVSWSEQQHLFHIDVLCVWFRFSITWITSCFAFIYWNAYSWISCSAVVSSCVTWLYSSV